MENGIQVWNKVLAASLSVPGIKVDRTDFLTKELSVYCPNLTTERIENSRPFQLVNTAIIDKIAKSCINNHTRLVTTSSVVAGIPGGFAMLATIPADMAQFYGHVLALSQKLAYLYGYPNLFDEKGELSEEAKDILTMFVGLMFGVNAANKVINQVAQALAKESAKRIPRMALTKTVWYPVLKQIGKWLGIKITRDSVGKSAGKIIPILGGLFSGTLTYATFKPGAKKLQKQMKESQQIFMAEADKPNDSDAEYVDAEEI